MISKIIDLALCNYYNTVDSHSLSDITRRDTHILTLASHFVTYTKQLNVTCVCIMWYIEEI